MSIKSLLQIILCLLIFLIIGGVYFFYFYSKPKIEQNLSLNNVEKFQDDIIIENKSLSEMSENSKISKLDKNENSLDNDNFSLKTNTIEDLSKKNQLEDTEEIKNLTKEIEYITSNKNGDIFKISAKYGKTNIKFSNILDLEKVIGVISSAKRANIYISSDFAKYNYDNQNSKFYGNVELKFDNKIITCNNLDLIISDNIAVAYNNVIMNDSTSTMKAQVVTLNTLTKDIKINSQQKIKIKIN